MLQTLTQKISQYWEAHRNTDLGAKILLNQMGLWRVDSPTEIRWKPTQQNYWIRPNTRDLNEVIAVAAGHEYPAKELNALGARPLLVDAGGHIGTFACWAGKLRPDATILSVEPEPTNQNLLKKNVDLNLLTDQVKIVHGAVGSHEGTMHLSLSAQTNGHQITDQATDHTIEVKTWTLSDLFKQVPDAETRPILLKMDIEGAEYDVLPQATAALAQVQTLFLEWHWKDAQDRAKRDAFLDKLLQKNGFAVRNHSDRIKIATRLS